MAARTPEDLDRQFAQAVNDADLDALVALYEPGASLSPSPGQRVSGHAAIREALAGFVAGKPQITLASRVVAQCGDVALTTSQWHLRGTGADGQPFEAGGESVEVARRQPGGDWLFAIDEPFGVGAPAA